MKYKILQKYIINYLKLVLILLIAIISSTNNTQAFFGGVDQTIRYSGKIYNSDSVQLGTGNYNMQIIIYDALIGGSILWTEVMDNTTTYGIPGVVCPKADIINGKFDLEIGSCNKDTLLKNILNNSNLYIEVQMDLDEDNIYEEIFSPRRKMTSVASSFNSLKLVSENTGTGNLSNLRISETGQLIYTGDDGVLPSTRFIIEPNGNVGIGTLIPSSTLDVAGTFNVSGSANIGDSLSVVSTISSGGVISSGGAITSGASISSVGTISAGGNISVGNDLGVTGNTNLNTLSVTGLSTLAGLSALDSVDISKSLATGVSKNLTIANRGADSTTTGVGTSILFETSGTNSSGRSAIRSIGVGTEGQDTKLSLYTSSDGTESNLTERLTVLSNGNVGINTDNPGYALQVGNNADGSEARANAWNTLSDISVKRDITQIDKALDKINQLKGYYYYWKNDIKDKSRQVGFVSQEVEQILPEVVSRGNDGLLSLDYSKMTPLILESIKELDTKLKSIELSSDLFRNNLTQESLNIKGLSVDGNVLIKGDLTVLGSISGEPSSSTLVNREINTSGDILVSDRMLAIDATNQEVVFNLIEDPKIKNKEIIIRKVDNSTNKVIISSSTSLIDGAKIKELESQYQFIRIIYDGKNWNIVGKDK